MGHLKWDSKKGTVLFKTILMVSLVQSPPEHPTLMTRLGHGQALPTPGAAPAASTPWHWPWEIHLTTMNVGHTCQVTSSALTGSDPEDPITSPSVLESPPTRGLRQKKPLQVILSCVRPGPGGTRGCSGADS